MKIPRTKEEPGKGGFWRLDPNYADRLVDGIVRKRRSMNSRQLNVMIDGKSATSSSEMDGDNELPTQVAIITPVVSAPRKRRRKDKVVSVISASNPNNKTRCGVPGNITVITASPIALQHQQSQDGQVSLANSSSPANIVNSTPYTQYNYLSSGQVNEINLNRENVLRIENCLTRSNLTNSQETPPSSPDSYSTVLNVSARF